MLFQQFYNLIDTMIVGRSLGAEALAAVGSTGALNFMIIGFCSGVCAGFAIPMAQAFGGKKRRCPEALHRKRLLALLVLCRYHGYCHRSAVYQPILRLMDTPENILHSAYLYIDIIFGAFLPLTFTICCPA